MEYSEYLRTVAKVPIERIPYWERWVAKYLRFQEMNSNSSEKTVLEQFSTKLAVSYADWQVRQALNAVKHYKYYLDREGEINTSTSDNADSTQNYAQSEDYDALSEKRLNWKKAEEQCRKVLILKSRSRQTEKSYLQWVRRFGEFLKYKDLSAVCGEDVKRYLSFLSVERAVAFSTQNQAFNALLFFFRFVLDEEIEDLKGAIRSSIPRRLPVVLSKAEITRIFKHLPEPYLFMCQIIYGGGLRLEECLSLRIKDVNHEKGILTVRSGKGNKDRQTLFPVELTEKYKNHLRRTKELYDEDRRLNNPGVPLPGALGRKYPNKAMEWAWYWVFPSARISINPRTGDKGRYHIYNSTLQQHFKKAVDIAQIHKRASVHTLRHSFATHLVEQGYDIRTVQELLGHTSLQTTMVYTHIAEKNFLGVRSPMSSLL